MSVYIYKLSQWLEKKFNAKGGSVITDLEQGARCVLPLNIGNEDRYTQGWNRFSIFLNISGVSAQFGRVRMRQPVGSNVIAIIERLYCWTLTAAADQPILTYGAATTDLANIPSLTFTAFDPRGNPQPTSIVSFNQQASGGSSRIQLAYTGANIVVEYVLNANNEITLLPGNVVDVQSNVANQQLSVGLIWRERALEPSELT